MSETLKTLSNSLADVVVGASESIVRIEGRRRLAASGIAWSKDGLIVTANHVLQRDENVQVGLPNGERVSAELVGRDPTTDLAVLRVDEKLTEVPIWQDDKEPKVGHIVLALGKPGESVQATFGVISALGSPWRTPAGGELARYIQTDVVMYPGFSGGPLVTASGQFTGLNTSALVRGVSMTIPAASLSTVAGDLIKHGQVRRGYLGVSLQIVRLPSDLQSELGQKTGLLIAGIEEGSPAALSGLFQGDILVEADSSALRHMDDLYVQLSGDRIGSVVAFKIVRAGKIVEQEVEIGTRKAE